MSTPKVQPKYNKTMVKNGKESSVEMLTADNYLVPVGEERMYHCVIEAPFYDSKTGKKLSRPRVQKYGRKIFDTVVRASLLKEGYDVRILHDPNEWIKAHKAEIAAKKAEAEKARQEAEQAKFDAAVAAAVKKALAEQKKSNKAKKEE